TGARVIDEKLCVGCGACTAACPWNIPVVDPETKKSTKCITCGACVAGCPTGALSIVEWKDIAAAV
ncbi:MAG: 4Fe-4S dicluster domain-containing protein, partial [Angelakisella sp.]